MSTSRLGDRFSAFSQKLTDHPYLILSFSSLVYLLLGLGQDGLNLDSTTYSVIARNMAETGRWFNPTYTPFYLPAFAEHPVLVIWIQALFFKLLGAGDSVARFHGALFTLGSVLMAYKFSATISGRVSGLLAGLTLLLTYNFMQMGNSALLDGPMTFFILVALWGMARIQQGKSGFREHIITGFALAGAFLSKGVVSAPIWIVFGIVFGIAIGDTTLFKRRAWFRSTRFWIIPSVAIFLIGVYLWLDQIYAGGNFRNTYFETKVWERFLGGGPDLINPWYHFTWEFAKLYQPFGLLIPVGLYIIVRQKMTLMYPLIFTLALYFLFYSSGARVYYHYFTPVYALCAPIAAIALSRWLRNENVVRQLATVILSLWLFTAIGVKISGMRIHPIRSREIYELKERMNRLLSDHPSRQGIILDSKAPNWDYIAKTSWYWRSDILTVNSFARAKEMLLDSGSFAYLIVPSDESAMIIDMDKKNWTRWCGNDKLSVFVPVTVK